MNALVVFYSRTGNTKRVAQAMATELKCDMEEIVDTKDRSGVVGYFLAGKDATLRTPAQIKGTAKDPALYDIVFIGTPVWAWTVSAPVRAYILQNRERFRQVAFFCTNNGTPSGTFREMEGLCGKKPAGVLSVTEEELDSGAHAQKVRGFVSMLQKN